MVDPASFPLSLFLADAGDPTAAPDYASAALKVFLVILLVLVNGFFVSAEFAYVGVRRSRVETLADDGSKGAKRLLGILDDLNAYLSATQLGITLASLALGALGEPTVEALLG